MYTELVTLFSSGSRVEVLKLFLVHPGSQFYQRQISRETGQPIRAVQREVERLEGIGLLARREKANRVFYRLNPAFPLLAELTALIQKATGAATAPRMLASEGALPETSVTEQPFAWMKSPAAEPLPAALRRRQVGGEWDRSY